MSKHKNYWSVMGYEPRTEGEVNPVNVRENKSKEKLRKMRGSNGSDKVVTWLRKIVADEKVKKRLLN